MLVIFEMLIRHNNQMLKRSKLFKILLVALPLSIVIYSINNSIIAELIKLDTELIVWYYLPFVVLGGFGFIWFIQQKFELNLFKKLLKRFRNGK